ncbi:MAG: hypothetical protein ABI263_06475 [Gelidibacter sp.]
MKIAIVVLKFASLFLLLSAFQCEDDTTSLTCEEKMSQLSAMEMSIQNLADTSVCNENFECRSVALGSKPCGGPWGYLVYSTSIDTLKLNTLVEKYNQFEAKINEECERFSDCAMVNPPERLECQNNRCIAVY